MQDKIRANARSDCGRPLPFPVADLTSLMVHKSYLSYSSYGQDTKYVFVCACVRVYIYLCMYVSVKIL